MSSQLEWTILDIEEEEWTKVTAAPGVGAAPNETAQSAIGDSPPMDGRRSTCSWWQIAGSVLLVVVVALLLGFRLLRTAEQGLTHMRGDVEVAVKAETLHQRLSLPASDKYATVEAVEFIGGDAMAQVVVTQTLAGGHVVGMHETQFFVMSPQGWTLSKPIAAFWGRRETLDTLHLHFVFGAKDRTIIAEVAPEAEEFYVALRRIVGYPVPEDISSSPDLLTIELVPRVVTECEGPQTAWLRLTSPLLYKPALGQPQSDILAAQLREALVHQVLDVDTPILQPRAQWVYMALGLRGWLLCSDRLPLASDFDSSGPDLVVPNRFAQLSGLVFDAGHRQAERSNQGGSALGVTGTGQPVDYALYSIWQQAATVLDFVAAEYGLDALGALVQGFARYEDWETLVPATLGISAQELEAGWLGRTVSVAQP